jgi:acyl carrier protein
MEGHVLPPPIGRPIANTEVYILDPNLQPVPIGVAGELHIGGAGLARGYHNRPGLTAEKFISNPFRSGAAARLYKTGDLVRWQPDGQIEYLGRLDHQVKIRGQRIELGEIEVALARHTGVREAVVVPRQDAKGENRLVAYLVASEGAKLPSESLRKFLKEKLPDAMVPSAFMVLKALPLTPNGKLDRNALPAPDFQGGSETPFVAPRTPTEEKLAAIWREVLGAERIGVHDNFFELGGHSLSATRVISRTTGSFQIELTLQDLFDSPTVAELAEKVGAVQWKPQETNLRAREIPTMGI